MSIVRYGVRCTMYPVCRPVRRLLVCTGHLAGVPGLWTSGPARSRLVQGWPAPHRLCASHNVNSSRPRPCLSSCINVACSHPDRAGLGASAVAQSRFRLHRTGRRVENTVVHRLPSPDPPSSSNFPSLPSPATRLLFFLVALVPLVQYHLAGSSDRALLSTRQAPACAAKYLSGTPSCALAQLALWPCGPDRGPCSTTRRTGMKQCFYRRPTHEAPHELPCIPTAVSGPL